MPTQLDPAGVEPRMLFDAADFRRARVLEVGCGDGRLAFRYADASAFVVGVEREATELAAARATCPPALRRRVRFIQATALALPFRSNTFDIAVLAWSL